MRSLGFLLLLTATAIAAPPALEVPKEAAGEPSAFIRIEAKTSGRNVRWVALDPGLNLFPIDLLRDSKTAVVTSAKPGRYRLLAVTAMNDEVSEPAVCTVVVGEAPPVPPPGPGPKPPEPKPDGTAPIAGDGFRVLVIYESAELPKLPAAQSAVLYAANVRDYLRTKCVKDTDNPQGAWRMWDKDVDTASESQSWKDAMKRERKGLPWILISNGRTGYEGPLPGTITETIALLQKYGGA